MGSRGEAPPCSTLSPVLTEENDHLHATAAQGLMDTEQTEGRSKSHTKGLVLGKQIPQMLLMSIKGFGLLAV